ncbi:hypothetical protein A0J57_03000 [Sphingobium sp. 22B]|nr:hypothetical protein AXW74_16100 [Sphingobium sp. AM]KYC34374.1 hypothetical protein A0J57_03000 [Sphingobium sp. 22B]OAP33987.1 hypothetical protein A8O16_02220 [Sphingobium sp. 20006FA]
MRQERRISGRANPPTAGHMPWTSLEKRLYALICIATLFFACVTPPFQAPDENQHFMKALLLSEGGMLTKQQGAMIGAEIPRAAIDLHDAHFPTRASPDARLFRPSMLMTAWDAGKSRADERRFADFPNVANYAPTLYLPGAAGLAIGKSLGLPYLGAFYSGRIVNALFALAMLAAALGLVPFGRNALLATALLPTFCYQNASLSPDAVINGMGFLGLALALRVGFMGWTAKRGLALYLTAPVLALAKGVYLPLMAAGLRWPESRRDLRPLPLLAAMVIGAFAFLLWMKLSGGTQALYHIVSRKTGETVVTAPLGQQLAVILHDPLAYLHILVTSVTERAPVYALQIVGRFGWNAILLPLLAYPLALAMLGAAIGSGSAMRVSWGQRLWWLAIAAGVALLIETAMYLTGTPLGADYIQGTQGRYFLPVLPLALVALMPAAPLRGARPLFAGSALLLLAIAAATVFDSFWVHGFVTADGMPPHHDPIRRLFLPSPRW